MFSRSPMPNIPPALCKGDPPGLIGYIGYASPELGVDVSTISRSGSHRPWWFSDSLSIVLVLSTYSWNSSLVVSKRDKYVHVPSWHDDTTVLIFQADENHQSQCFALCSHWNFLWILLGFPTPGWIRFFQYWITGTCTRNSWIYHDLPLNTTRFHGFSLEPMMFGDAVLQFRGMALIASTLPSWMQLGKHGLTIERSAENLGLACIVSLVLPSGYD